MGETLVVGFDGSEGSGRALDRAIQLASEGGGKVVVVAVEYMPVAPAVPSMVNLDLTTVREPTPLMSPGPTQELQAVLDRAKAKVEAAGVEGEYVWAFGDPGGVIVDAARDHGAARIVIGADHHRFLDRLLGGNVEAEVRREADADYEIVVVD